MLLQKSSGGTVNGGRKLPEELSSVDTEVAYTAASVTGTLDLYGKMIQESINDGKETVNMCEAVRKVLEEERQIGELKGELKVARKMLLAGKEISEIMQFTELTEDQIKELRN